MSLYIIFDSTMATSIDSLLELAVEAECAERNKKSVAALQEHVSHLEAQLAKARIDLAKAEKTAQKSEQGLSDFAVIPACVQKIAHKLLEVSEKFKTDTDTKSELESQVAEKKAELEIALGAIAALEWFETDARNAPKDGWGLISFDDLRVVPFDYPKDIAWVFKPYTNVEFCYVYKKLKPIRDHYEEIAESIKGDHEIKVSSLSFLTESLAETSAEIERLTADLHAFLAARPDA